MAHVSAVSRRGQHRRVFRIPSSLFTRAGALPKEGAIHISLANAPQP